MAIAGSGRSRGTSRSTHRIDKPAKAKQTKVARELKYSSHGTDLDALRAELAGERRTTGNDSADGLVDDELDDDDPYADYASDEDDDEDDDDEDEATSR